MKTLQVPFHEQQKGLLLAETSAMPSNHGLVPLFSNKCWSSPFPRHSCLPSPSLELGALLWFCACVSSGLDEHTPFTPARLQHYVQLPLSFSTYILSALSSWKASLVSLSSAVPRQPHCLHQAANLPRRPIN